MLKVERRVIKKPIRSRAAMRDAHNISAAFESDAYVAFKMLGAAQCKTSKGLLNEALALLFEKHKRAVPPSVRKRLDKLGIK